MDATMIHAELDVRNCSAELYVNDIPIRKLDSKVQPFISVPVHQFLVGGTNTVELVINPGDTPSRAREGSTELPTAGVQAEARVVRYQEGMFTGDPDAPKIASATWIPGGATVARFPAVVKADFSLDIRFGRWAWQDAAEIDLARDMEGIMETVRTVHEAFRTGAPESVLALADLRLQEGARAYPARTLDSLRARQADYFRRNARREGWAIVPLDPEQHDFRLCAGGRVVEIVDKSWDPTIRSFPMGATGTFPFPMFLSQSNGRFVIVR